MADIVEKLHSEREKPVILPIEETPLWGAIFGLEGRYYDLLPLSYRQMPSWQQEFLQADQALKTELEILEMGACGEEIDETVFQDKFLPFMKKLVQKYEVPKGFPSLDPAVDMTSEENLIKISRVNQIFSHRVNSNLQAELSLLSDKEWTDLWSHPYLRGLYLQIAENSNSLDGPVEFSISTQRRIEDLLKKILPHYTVQNRLEKLACTIAYRIVEQIGGRVSVMRANFDLT